MKGLEQIRADEEALAAARQSRRLDETTDTWVLRAKVAAYETALNELVSGVRGIALTLREWAVAAGGHTPSAIVASRLLQLVGDEKAPPLTEADIALSKEPR